MAFSIVLEGTVTLKESIGRSQQSVPVKIELPVAPAAGAVALFTDTVPETEIVNGIVNFKTHIFGVPIDLEADAYFEGSVTVYGTIP